MATINDVAREAGVSKATVSKVLNNAGGPIEISQTTRNKVLAAARKLHYHPNVSAKRLAVSYTNVIGVVITCYKAFQGSVNADILQGLGETLSRKGYSMELVSAEATPNLEDRLRDMTLGKQVDGLIMWTHFDSRLCEFLNEQKIPHCHVQVRPSLDECPAVVSDNTGGAFMATCHLIERGHRRIAIVVNQDFHEGHLRLQGYKQALEQSGIDYDPDLVIQGTYSARAAGLHLDRKHLERVLPDCTAVFATSDLLAITVGEIIRQNGYLIGRPTEQGLTEPASDFRALVGFDGLEISEHMNPQLSTVCQDGYEMGKLAAITILRQVQGKAWAGRLEVVPVRFVARESS